MKNKIIHGCVLLVIFLGALAGFGYLTNRGNTDLGADIGSASLPRISFETEGYAVNTLPGYVTEMEIPTMRDTVTPVSNQQLAMKIDAYGEKIDKVSWKIYTLDGKKCLQEKDEETTDELRTLYFEDGILRAERVLKVTLQFDGREAYYYTRVKSAVDCNYKACLDFTQELFDDIQKKENTDVLTSYLEGSVSGQGDLSHVTIESSTETVLWNGLEPKISRVSWEVKECNPAITSIVINYKAQFADGESVESYNVQEFFQVRMVGEKRYLMDYDRTMSQLLDGSEKLFEKNAVRTGCSPESLNYKTNEKETIVAFVQDDELWSYDSKENCASLIFRFGSDENTDRRNDYHRYEIEILSVAENGDVIFNVSGYMNRGDHEGQVGVAIYLYEPEKNAVSEKAFVPSARGYYYMKNTLGKCVYYGEKAQTLYVMMDGNLYSVNMEDETRSVLARGLVEGQYVVSDSGMMIAYQDQGGEPDRSAKITVLDMQYGNSFEITAPEGSYIRPIGFMKTDFVYGSIRPEDEGKNAADVAMLPMYQVSIVSEKNQVLKTYEMEGISISDGQIEGNMLTLDRVVRSGDSYAPTSPDYITNNEENENSNVVLETYQEAGTGTCQKLTFVKADNILRPKILKPQLARKEKALIVQLDDSERADGFFAFAKGEMRGLYEHASTAVAEAEKLGGTAVSARGTYLYERGNRDNAYEVDRMEPFAAEMGETSMEACVRKILQLEGAEVAKASQIREGKTSEAVLEEALGTEALDLTGCTVEQILYLIGRETPVIAVTGVNEAVLLTGYNKTNVVYLNPADGTRQSVSIAELQQKISENGNIFIGYEKGR